MPIQTDSLNRKLYDLLNTRGYNPVPRDSDVNNAGKTVPPEEADVFKFTFKQNGEDIDDVWATIDGAENLTLYYDHSVADKAGDKSPGSQFDDSWYGLLNFLKKWAHARQLSFKLEPKEKIDSDMAQRTYMKKKEQIAEGYYPMGKSASYNDAVPTVKIILQHTRQIQEGEQRYRNIAKIFLENTQGERILAPTVKPGIAQVYARHLAEGGVPNDERWNHIKGLCEEYSKMAGFVRAVRGNQFNESAQRLVEAGLNHYQSLRESLGKMRGHRGYNAYFESYTPPLMEDESDESTLNELFVQETLDPRIESVMPILNKLSKTLGEMKEVKELEEWADSLTEAPGAETLAHNQATEKSRLDAFDLDEADDAEAAHKKTQVPAFMRKQSGNPDWKTTAQDLEKAKERNISGAEGLAALKKRMGDIEESDGDPKSHQAQTTLKHLKKASYGDRADAANIKPGIAGYKDRIDMLKRAEREGNLKEEDVEESGLQAYLGNKKYGKEGMDALRKAGRDGASKEKMANIRAKYDKLDEEGVSEGLDVVKRGRLNDLIELYRDATDPSDYYDRDYEDPDEVIAMIRKEFGDKIASQVEAGAHKMHFPRDNHSHGSDPLGWKPKGDHRVTKAGKMYKQDSDYMKNTIKSRYKFGGKSATEGVAEGSLEEYGDTAKGQKMLDKVHNRAADRVTSKQADKDPAYARKAQQTQDRAWERLAVKEQGVAEDLDANQKRVGQLGPTEKVKNNNIGKLVGANESRINEMDSEGYKGHRGDEDSGKGSEKYVKPAKAKDVAKDAEKALNKSMDKAHKKDVKEGQEELESLLKLLGK